MNDNEQMEAVSYLRNVDMLHIVRVLLEGPLCRYWYSYHDKGPHARGAVHMREVMRVLAGMTDTRVIAVQLCSVRPMNGDYIAYIGHKPLFNEELRLRRFTTETAGEIWIERVLMDRML